MPHFTLQIGPQGPMLDALVGVSQARRTALAAVGQPVPNPIRLRALVDTGASGTSVDPSITSALNLTPTGRVQVVTPSTGSTPHEADQYDVALIIPSGGQNTPFILPTIAVMSCEL